MTVSDQVAGYIAAQPEPKRSEMQTLHELALRVSPDARLWFLDCRDDKGKVVSNPNIGYGSLTIDYASGKSREFYKLGLSGNTTGISVYVMGLDDKKHLSNAFGPRLGKASVSGYCIKFKSLQDVDFGTLEEVFRFGLGDRA